METLVTHAIRMTQLEDHEINAGMWAAVPVGFAGIFGSLVVLDHHNQSGLYNQLRDQKDSLSAKLTTLESFNSDSTLKAIEASPKKVDAAKTQLSSQIAVIEDRTPNQYSIGETAGIMFGSEFALMGLAFCVTLAAMRTKAHLHSKNQLKNAEYRKSLRDLSGTLVNPSRFSQS